MSAGQSTEISMSDDNANESSSRTDAGLDGLPASERAETEKILNEIDRDAQSGNEPKDEKKPDEPKGKEGDKKPDGEKKPEEGDKGKQPEGRREVKLMPAWLHERAKADWDKKEKDLNAAIEAAKTGTSVKKEGENSDANVPKDDAFAAKVKALAEKHGITAELATDLTDLIASKGGLPPEVAKQLEEVDKFRESEAVKAELAAFNSDFDKDILPLIHAEYGKDVSSEIVADIREKLKEKAYSTEYGKVPFQVIYNGVSDFRGIIPPKKKGAEPARGGQSSSSGEGENEGKPDLSKPLSDDELKALSDEDFDKYQKNMADNEIRTRSSN